MNRRSQRGHHGNQPKRPGPAEALLAEAKAHHREGRSGEAIEAYRKVMALAPNSVDALMNLANLLAQGGHRDEAVSLYRRAAKLMPKSAELHHDMGAALLGFGLFEEAIASFQRAIALAPGAAPPFAKLGEALLEVGRREEAVAALQQSILRDPLAARTYYELYRAAYDTRDLRPALDAITRAVANDQDFVIARFWLAATLAQHGDAKAAKQLFDDLHDKGVLRGAIDSYRYVEQVKTPEARFVTTTREGLRLALSLAPAEGLLVELGVRYGISTRWLAEGAGAGGVVHGFDSFEGLPEEWHIQPKGVYSTHGALPHVPENVRLHVGLFDATLPPFLAEHPGPLRLLHVDCDLYSSTREALSLLTPRVAPGTIIVFDEYLINDAWREDEFKAFQEVVAEQGYRYEYLAFNLCTGQTVVRMR